MSIRTSGRVPANIRKYRDDIIGKYLVWNTNLHNLLNTITRSPAKVIELRQSDFKNGTVVISTDYYIHTNSDGNTVKVTGSTKNYIFRLMENITFEPNPPEVNDSGVITEDSVWNSSSPQSSQFTHNGGEYDTKAYGIGFFAAIALSATHVILDLNNYKIEQGLTHYLHQRFYSNIELGNQPFIPSQGPHNFGETFTPASNCCIINGKIGRSSHHGIHGNSPKMVLLSNLELQHYEIASIHINAGMDIMIENTSALGNCSSCPVFGSFSAARFIRPYLDYLVSTQSSLNINIAGVNTSVTTIRNNLKRALYNVYTDVITDRSTTGGFIKSSRSGTGTLGEWDIFHNYTKRTDGNQYGMAFHSTGVAVHGFITSQPATFKSDNIYLYNVTIRNNHAQVNEIPSLSGENDVVGAVFQTQHKNASGTVTTLSSDGKYVGNVISNAQAVVAKAIHNGVSFGSLSVSRNRISLETLKLVSGDKTIHTIDTSYRYNSDTMNHVNKGCIGIRIDGTVGFYAKNLRVIDTTNKGKLGYTNKTLPIPVSKTDDIKYICKVGKSIPTASLNGYNGAHTRGISVAGCDYCEMENVIVDNISSQYGYSVGLDIMFGSNRVRLKNLTISGVLAGQGFIGDGATNIGLLEGNPTHSPTAIGIRTDSSTLKIDGENVVINTNSFSSPIESMPTYIRNTSTRI